jgi:tRNA threonylcarbamoyl adenosine modification protein YeaZ
MGVDTTITLGVETSGPFTYLAVLRGDEVLARSEHLEKFSHSEALNPMFGSILEETGLTVGDIDRVAVSIGPGYFTALRAGLAFGKAIAYALGKPIIGVNTLDALARAECARDAPKVVPATDAQKRMVYAAVYGRKEGILKRQADYLLVSPEELKKKAGDALFLGSGAGLYPEVLSPRPEPNPSVPSAEDVARLGREIHRTDGPSDLDALEPFYIRVTDAEAKVKSL